MRTVALREIRSAARRPATYWTRVAAGAIGSLLLVSMGAMEGRTLFYAAITLGVFLCLMEGVRQGSTAIVEERVDGTLGLLLLTRLRGAELLFGKFAALAFSGVQTLLAVAPILAISFLMGGVSLGEFTRATVAFAHTLLISISIGLVISARSREPARAMLGTFFLLFGSAIALSLRYWPSTGWSGFLYNVLSPCTPIWMIADTKYQNFTREYWLCLAITTAAALAFLAFASWRLSRQFMSEGEAGPTTATAQKKLPRPERRAKWFEGNPIEWLTLRNLRMNGRAGLSTAIALAASAVILMTGFYGFFVSFGLFLVFGFLYSAGAAVTFGRARQTGEVELWLTTPLTVKEIVNGHISALRKIFLWPGFIMICAYATFFYVRVIKQVILGSMSVSIQNAGPDADPLWPVFIILGSTILSMTSLLFALPYVAMWIALKTKTPAQATVRTFLLMIISPWFIFFVPKVLLFVPLALVASHSVKSTLKNFALQRARG